MHASDQQFVVVDVRTGKKADDFFMLLRPEYDPHAREAMKAYVRSVAFSGELDNARRLNSVLRSFKCALPDDDLVRMATKIRLP